MRRASRGRAAIVLALLFFCVAPIASGQAATLVIQSESPGLQGSRIYLGAFVGFVGDLIQIPKGKHRMRIAYSPSTTQRKDWSGDLYIDLLVGADDVEILSLPEEVGLSVAAGVGCSGYVSVAAQWEEPRIGPHSEIAGLTEVRLEEPRFPPGPFMAPTICGVRMACAQSHIVLKVESEPPGAEIWIGGERSPFATPATLSVPYCEGDKQTGVLIRMSGRVNCRHAVDLLASAEQEVSCRLAAP